MVNRLLFIEQFDEFGYAINSFSNILAFLGVIIFASVGVTVTVAIVKYPVVSVTG
jgi:hypothetical protein